MSQFEQPVDEYEIPSEAKQTSKAAIAGLICSLVLCCPLTTIPGIILGLVGFFATGRNAMLKGRGLAAAAIIIGVLATAGQSYVIYTGYSQMYLPMVEGPHRVLQPASVGNFDAARAACYGTAASASDAEIKAFFDELERRFGKYERAALDESRIEQDFSSPDEKDYPYLLFFSNEPGGVSATMVLVHRDQAAGKPIVMKAAQITVHADDGDIVFPAGRSSIEGSTGESGSDDAGDDDASEGGDSDG